jgi:hypothetical protein
MNVVLQILLHQMKENKKHVENIDFLVSPKVSVSSKAY